MNNLDPDLKNLFDMVGVTVQQVQDKETASFIYDFIEQHGGVQRVKEEPRRPPPPPRSYKIRSVTGESGYHYSWDAVLVPLTRQKWACYLDSEPQISD